MVVPGRIDELEAAGDPIEIPSVELEKPVLIGGSYDPITVSP